MFSPSALVDLLHPAVLAPWLLGMVFGIFVGSTPGLTATMAVALIVPISYHLPPAAGLALIIGVSFTAIFAGDIPATYLRIPGTPASAAATLDGHMMARQGKGRLALQLDLLCSSIGGLIGVVLLVLVAPQLARFALQFTFYEYFWLGLLGLSMSALVSQSSLFKGLTAAALGMLLSTVGVSAAVPRFTLGSSELMNGLEVIPLMIGLFGMAEVFRALSSDQSLAASAAEKDEPAPLMTTLLTIWRHKLTVVISSLTGTVVGALPGAGADIAAWAAYGVAQRTSREPERFGKGIEEGVIAPTSANNAAVGGAWIPALVFGVPGDAVTAIVLPAMLVYNVKPGPRIFTDSGEVMQQLFAIALLTQVLLLPAGLLGLRAFRLVLSLPRAYILTGVMIFSVVGSFAVRQSMFDVYVMLAAGLLGWFLEARQVPVAPVVLGLILGPIVEDNLRRGMISGGGSFVPFITRPYCLAMIALLAVGLLAPLAMRLKRRLGESPRQDNDSFKPTSSA